MKRGEAGEVERSSLLLAGVLRVEPIIELRSPGFCVPRGRVTREAAWRDESTMALPSSPAQQVVKSGN